MKSDFFRIYLNLFDKKKSHSFLFILINLTLFDYLKLSQHLFDFNNIKRMKFSFKPLISLKSNFHFKVVKKYLNSTSLRMSAKNKIILPLPNNRFRLILWHLNIHTPTYAMRMSINTHAVCVYISPELEINKIRSEIISITTKKVFSLLRSISFTIVAITM